MTTTTSSSTLHRAPLAAPTAPPRALAIGLVARWCAAQFTRPLYHRLGAFDLARSGLARELLQNVRR